MSIVVKVSEILKKSLCKKKKKCSTAFAENTVTPFEPGVLPASR